MNPISPSASKRLTFAAGLCLTGMAAFFAPNAATAQGSSNSSYTISTLAGVAPGSADGTGTAARFFGPSNVAVDGSGNLYVVDGSNHTIRKITPAGVVTTLAGLAGHLGFVDGTGSAALLGSTEGPRPGRLGEYLFRRRRRGPGADARRRREHARWKC